ncbi:glycine cleavage system protein GcvH [Magnetospirillum sp. 64-120]|uniref:glycine cleavage system protein GcvH n=1 Tax=Magnetospirillum sp. 64-120 TaxID=1895778 RepID=UPI0025BADA55|nr:glycine cleavage system protein GcvH [Magnetospirillum sp. 64-120]
MMSMYFTKDHEWISVEGSVGTVGITDYAQKALGDIVYAEVPEKGRKVTKGGDAAVVESVKAASEVYSPVSGTVTAGNDALAGQPALVNESPEGDGWFFKLELSNPAELEELMDRAAYDDYVAGLE